MANKCVNCGKRIPSFEIICEECIEKDRKNPKLQKLIKESVKL